MTNISYSLSPEQFVVHYHKLKLMTHVSYSDLEMLLKWLVEYEIDITSPQ